LSDFNETIIFLAVLQKNSPISNFMKLHPVGTSCSMWSNTQKWWS